MEELMCYNNACGSKFKAADNKKDSCRHHPGGPIFHDALKGWSCCKKRTCDFTEFLNIPGCTYALHNNVKPTSVEPAKKQEVENSVPKEIIIKGPIDNILPQKNRPSETEPLTQLKATVGASLKSALLKSMEEMKLASTHNQIGAGEFVAVGTCCKNSACKENYVDESSNLSPCLHHPGTPVFHEGMKYWSCCQRKTTDFDNFMSQEGCSTGQHIWKKDEVDNQKVDCRTDWHQTEQFVTISAFAKVADPDLTIIKCNQVVVEMIIVMKGGKEVFKKNFTLKGIVDPERSSVKLLGTKVEVNLRKACPGKWSALRAPPREEIAVVDARDDETDAAVASL